MASKLLDEDASMDEILASIERIVASPSDPPPRRRWWKRLADRLFPVRRRLTALEAEVRRIGSAVDTRAAASEDADRGKGRVLTQAEIDSLLSDTGWVLGGVRPARYAVTRAMERAAGYLDDLPTVETLRILARMALIWNGFIAGHPSLSGIKHLQQHAERAGDWPSWRGRALSTIRERLKAGRGVSRSLLVDIFLWEGDSDAAWREARAGGCSPAHWLQLAELREGSHPADALAIYRERLPDVLPATGSGDYPRAIALIGKIGTLLTALGRTSEFQSFVAGLRVQHKRKRNFIALLGACCEIENRPR